MNTTRRDLFSALAAPRRLALILSIAGLAGLPSVAAQAFTPEELCPNAAEVHSGNLSTDGAEYVICEPEFGFGDVVIYSHGTVRVTNSGTLAEIADELNPGGLSLPDLFNNLGFVFATVARVDTGISEVGQAKKELKTLAKLVHATVDTSGITYLVGASAGSLFATQLVERRPDLFDGGLAACGPIGKFRKQITFWGNLIVVVDYFFPRLGLPKSSLLRNLDRPKIRAAILNDWESPGGYQELITNALQDDPGTTREIRRVTGVATDPDGNVPDAEAIVDSLETAIFLVEDAFSTFGGETFGNKKRLYLGSDNDLLLNFLVKRFSADSAALDEVKRYETSASLSVPLVTLHTFWDPIVPSWHQALYETRALLNGSPVLPIPIPVFRFGHCAFEPAEALAAFALLVLQTQGLALVNAESLLPSIESQLRFRVLADELGLNF